MEEGVKEEFLKCTVDLLWDMELLGGVKAEGLFHMGDIIIPQGGTMDEPSIGTLAAKPNGCANVDKSRLVFNRLHFFQGSDDGSKLINCRDQETNKKSEK